VTNNILNSGIMLEFEPGGMQVVLPGRTWHGDPETVADRLDAAHYDSVAASTIIGGGALQSTVA